ncbi:MAG: YceI family protein [Pseudomonadota bacterium]|nr:YceI family protein [Pseudomonadota bacterium]
MKKLLLAVALSGAVAMPGMASAADYKLDVEGAHAFINFKIKHLGYSWLTGRFNTFDGQFSYDAANPEASSIEVIIDTASIDSNHAERDKHLRGEDFLNVSEFPKATFKSTSYKAIDEDSGELTGVLTLHGVTKTISFPVEKLGEGNDPWGGYRAGFTGTTSLKLTDYGINYNLGPASTHVDLELHIEGSRQ